MNEPIAVMWFRRDLRLEDNTALNQALAGNLPVLPVFLFDRQILDRLTEKKDRRVQFIHDEIVRLDNDLHQRGSGMKTYYAEPLEAWQKILESYNVQVVFFNRDYEPYARQRDAEITAFLNSRGIEVKTSKDHVIFEQDEIIKGDGTPYTVFTPYSRKWKLNFTLARTEIKSRNGRFFPVNDRLCSLDEMGFKSTAGDYPSREIPMEIVANYHETRDIPSIDGTTHLSVHLRFGTVSIRHLVQIAYSNNEKWLNELIWRDFYQMILYQFPYSVDRAIKPQYDRIAWSNNEEHFSAWCTGKTGYPLVDAGMRELNATGYMHNRVRMVVASFLVKHLLIDWRWGERYFAQQLLDFELASNVGGWQWAAGSGCDAAPYFRIFNPTSQQERFDPDFRYIRKWVPEFGTPMYPAPIVDHSAARERALRTFKEALNS